MHLDGKTFRVSAPDVAGVVSSDTCLHLVEKGSRVLGRYSGGGVARGYLVGFRAGASLTFRYAQREADGHVHGGHSHCDLQQLPDGRVTLSEHFTWETRQGSGTNRFEELGS